MQMSIPKFLSLALLASVVSAFTERSDLSSREPAVAKSRHGKSPNHIRGLLVERQICGVRCSDGGCCDIGDYCTTVDGIPGCCAIGKICDSIGGCSGVGNVKCPGKEFCCPAGDSACCASSGGGGGGGGGGNKPPPPPTSKPPPPSAGLPPPPASSSPSVPSISPPPSVSSPTFSLPSTSSRTVASVTTSPASGGSSDPNPFSSNTNGAAPSTKCALYSLGVSLLAGLFTLL